ncbi:MAG TPA: PDDEXK nuclease domain-containing protein [Burkholderiaceae bacterium]|nr:PDDEXK nuclease domain-containing protein [Burkholderiaceae bacterium]
MPPAMTPTVPALPADLVNDVRQLIERSRTELARVVNSALTLLYWRIGQRIRLEILRGERAEYGEQIISTLARQLEREFGRGFSSKNLRHMVRFTEAYSDLAIVSALSRQLAWSHFLELIYLKDPLQRDFYAQMCERERWSVRQLRERKDTMLFERTAISTQPDSLLAQELAHLRNAGELAPDLVFKDPYLLDFLGLQACYQEKDLEDAILREMERFLLELGAGFTFVARQKRIQLDNDDFYIDLLFYNRRLKRLVAVDLKLGDFKASDKGQMELYLRWLAKYEQEPGEASPLGIILCSGKKQEQIELLELGASGIHVAEYLTQLPPKDLLQKKLRDAIAQSRARLEGGRAERA